MFVKNKNEIRLNLTTLKKYSTSPIEEEREFYLGRIKLGTCFIVYLDDGKLEFAPSRFIGYLNNDMKYHKNNNERDGRKTNKIITNILGVKPRLVQDAEYAYLDYCKKLGIIPKLFGAFNAPRKYWLLGDKVENYLLENYTELDKEKIDKDEIEKSNSTSKKVLVDARKGQGKYRKELIELWKECPITKCDVMNILKASHIKPWRNSSDKEKLDKYNGILLSPTYDTLFDKGLISFNGNGLLMISRKISKNNQQYLGIDSSMRIKINSKSEPYLRFHRENIYEK